MAGKAGVLRGKNTTSCYLFLFYFIIHFMLLDNSIAYMFIHSVHAYAHILLHKMDGSRRHILKGTVEGNTPPSPRPAIPHRVGGDHEFSVNKTVTPGGVAQSITCLTRCMFDCRPKGC